MPKDIRFKSKKRSHPDGFLHCSSASKRLLSISEAEPDSSVDSARNSTISPEWPLVSAHGSLWNSSSAVVTSDCSASASAGPAPMCANVASPKQPLSGRNHWHSFSDVTSNNMEASQNARGPSFESSPKDVWRYRATCSNFEDTDTDSECSEVTCARASLSVHESKVDYDFGKATHIISRREKSSSNAKWGVNEGRFTDAFGSDVMMRQKQWESSSGLPSVCERRGFRAMAAESGSSCSTNDTFFKEMRPKQGISYSYGSVFKEFLASSPSAQARVEGLVGPASTQERYASFGYLNTRHSSATVGSSPPVFIKGKVEDSTPSYVLSSGRPSLEEEARMGRRASTIDHDFEEYFSSLMLE